MVEQNAGVLAEADRALVMQKGRIVHAGSVAAVSGPPETGAPSPVRANAARAAAPPRHVCDAESSRDGCAADAERGAR